MSKQFFITICWLIIVVGAGGEAAPSANQVNMHESVGDWLSTFAGDEKCGGERDDEQQVENFRKRKQMGKVVASAHSRLQADSCIQSSNVADTTSFYQHASGHGSEILPEGNVRLVICDLEKQGSNSRFVEEVLTTQDTLLYQVILDLVQKGK